MRNGTGYYRYNSLEDFLSGAAPESFALTYGFNGVANPNAQVTFNQLGFYAQDEWNLGNSLKLTYGIRFDNFMFDNDDLQMADFSPYRFRLGRVQGQVAESTWRYGCVYRTSAVGFLHQYADQCFYGTELRYL